MDSLERLLEKKRELLDEICKLKEMREGSVVPQYYERKLSDGTTSRQGPYFLYSYKEGGRTISRRLCSAAEAQRYREQIDEFRKFEQLRAQLVQTSQKISDLKLQEALPEDGVEKKRRRPLSKRWAEKLRG